MNVVGRVTRRIGLHIDKFHEERRSLDAVVMSRARRLRACPGEVEIVPACRFDRVQASPDNIVGMILQVNFDQLPQQFLLGVVQLCSRDTRRLFLRRLGFACGADLFGSRLVDDGNLLLLIAQGADQLKCQGLFLL